jgi:acylphosphatase
MSAVGATKDHTALRLIIRGRVQGVGFRYAFADEARARKLRGWVRNRRDGSVEAIVAGPAAAVDAIVAWSRRGPSAAQVTAVETTATDGDFASFEVAPTV